MSTEIKPEAIRDQDEAISLSYWLAEQMGEHVDDQGDETLTETVQRYVSREWMPKTGANSTPAPLDPSKVTVEITDWEDFRPGDVVVQNPDADRVEGAAFLVERHQPAPEPEPEPGYVVGETIADISIRGCHAAPLTTLRGLRRDGGWRTSGGNWDDVNVENVRPLVVIDPAAVDAEMLVQAIRHDGGRAHPDDWAATRSDVLVVLAELGIKS